MVIFVSFETLDAIIENKKFRWKDYQPNYVKLKISEKTFKSSRHSPWKSCVPSLPFLISMKGPHCKIELNFNLLTAKTTKSTFPHEDFLQFHSENLVGLSLSAYVVSGSNVKQHLMLFLIPCYKSPVFVCSQDHIHGLDSIQGTDYITTPIQGFLGQKLKI